MTLLWSFDPGLATGWAVGDYSEDEPYRLMTAGIVDGGALGFINWWTKSRPNPWPDDTVVSESFTLNAGNEFVADTTPREVEGALMALYQNPIHWQPRSAKAGVPDSLLKAHDIWMEGDDVDWTDGRDANDAIIHALEYLRRRKHMPTLRAYFKDE